MQLSFPLQSQFEFAAIILTNLPPSLSGKVNVENRTIEVIDVDIAVLLERVASTGTTMLPVMQDESDKWMLVATDRYAAERAWGHVSRFVLPSYGVLPSNMPSGSFHSFANPEIGLSTAAQAGYGGYIECHTPAQDRQTVLRRLGLWARMEAKRPSLTIERPPQYPELFAAFKSALAVMNWADAESILGEMRRLHLATSDNLRFLQLQLLAQQGRWEDIWHDRAFPVMAAQQLPRSIRTVLIVAFHQTVLHKLELANDLDAALMQFRTDQARLGLLLTGRFGLADSAVLRVFAYQAAVERDAETLDQMLLSTEVDIEARRLIESLRSRLPAPTHAIVPPAERLRQAMQLRDYDRAASAAAELEDRIERTIALLHVAYRHPDAVVQALDAYETLTSTEIAILEEEDLAANLYLQHALGIMQTLRPDIASWPDWFDRMLATPNDPALAPAIDGLIQQADDRLWNPDMVRIMFSKLESLLNLPASVISSRTTQRGVNAFVDQLLTDTEFPRDSQEYAELYEALLDWMVLSHAGNEDAGRKLLRLAEINLRHNPTQAREIARELCKWFDRPTLALEELLLDAFDLLINYGVERQGIHDSYRNWLRHLLDLPATTSWPRTSREVWLSIGEWLHPGDDLMRILRQQLELVIDDSGDDALIRLPPGCRVAVFTLNPAAARRAGAIIQLRNPDVRIEICSDTVLTESAKRLATRADVPVIVSTCLTHALFYGIKPFLRIDPVFPAFQGATSIVRAIEGFVDRL